jgi:hypothetical protein
LLAGWSDKNGTTQFDFQYAIFSFDEAAAAQGRSYVVLNAVGGGLQHFPSAIELEMELILDEPAVNPEAWIGGAWDLGGTSGYPPVVGPAAKIRFRTMDTSNAAPSGYAALHVANIAFQASAAQCHVPGFALLGQHLPVNVDALWILTLPALVGAPFTPKSSLGPYWNPNAGWSPGGESTSPALPITLPGLVGLQLCFGSDSFEIGGNPIVNAASNGSTLRFR